ncbi:MAG: hypothetical protein HC801_12390 [Nitrospira sp.]|nr:hypothetical protein [Nitrospira sp.]
MISETIGEISSLSHSSSSPPTMQTKQNIWETEPEIPVTSSVAMEAVETRLQKSELPKESVVEARAPMPEPGPHQEEWQKAGESIRFVEEPKAASMAKVAPPVSEPPEMIQSLSAAASAVDVLFESTPDLRKTETKERVAETISHRKHASILSSIRIGIAGFLRTCFSTTRAIVATFVGLMVLSAVGVALCIGAIGLTWVIMEEPPSPAFQSLTTTPQRTLSDSRGNGYLLLLGIEAATGQDPIQAGYERDPDAVDGKAALTCLGVWDRGRLNDRMPRPMSCVDGSAEQTLLVNSNLVRRPSKDGFTSISSH